MIRNLYDGLRRRRDRGQLLVNARRESSRLASELTDRELDVQRLSAEVARAREANNKAAEEIVRLTLDLEGTKAMLAARDALVDSLEESLERYRQLIHRPVSRVS